MVLLIFLNFYVLFLEKINIDFHDSKGDSNDYDQIVRGDLQFEEDVTT